MATRKKGGKQRTKGQRADRQRLSPGTTNLDARQKEWAEAKPRSDVDDNTAILPDTQTHFTKPGSQNRNK